MSELLDILQIAVGTGLVFLGYMVVHSEKKLWWTGLIMVWGGFFVVANVFGFM